MASNDLSLLGDIDENVLKCSVCNGRLEDPKSLSCSHSFCLKCLEKWVQTNGKLTCPICRKLDSIPEGGLEKLAENLFLNYLLETIQQHEKNDEMKCICESAEQATHYCKQCRHYLCYECSNHHKKLPITANHMLFAVEEQLMTEKSKSATLDTPMCFFHTKPLEMYCIKCKVPICIECTEMKHEAGDGKHELINIATAFKTFETQTSVELKKDANESFEKIENALKVVTKNAKELEDSKETSLRDIDNKVQDILKIIKKKGDELKKKVETFYENEKKANDVLMTRLRTINLSFLNRLLTSKAAPNIESSEIVLNKLKDEINNYEKIHQDSKQIAFIQNNLIDYIQRNNIGNVTLRPLTIKLKKHPFGVAKCDDDCLLVSFYTNTIYKYKLSGKYISNITLPEGVKVEGLYKMRNGNIVFSDEGNRCIQVCDNNGHVIRSIGKGVFSCGIHKDESLNVLYVADMIGCVLIFDINSGKQLNKIQMQKSIQYINGQQVRSLSYYDVTLSKTGKILVADQKQSQVLLYDNKDKSIKILINKGDLNGSVNKPRGVVVDDDDNIIVASCNKLQLFSSDGKFIRRIDQQDDGINDPRQLCIISHNPCKVAVVSYGDRTIKTFNY